VENAATSGRLTHSAALLDRLADYGLPPQVSIVGDLGASMRHLALQRPPCAYVVTLNPFATLRRPTPTLYEALTAT